MKEKIEFTCHAVVKGILVEDKIIASSIKQARYKYCNKHGYAIYDFKTIGQRSIIEQLKFVM